MANRQMAFQWTQLKFTEVVGRLESFSKLAGIHDACELLEQAMERCKLDEKTKKEFKIVREVFQLLRETNRQPDEIRVVIVWRNSDVTSGYTLQVEYLGRQPSSVSKA